MVDVIYLAAGQGKRARLGYPKQFARLGGKPVLVHGLELLQNMTEVDQIIIACPPASEKEGLCLVEEVVLSYGITKAIFVEGGQTRQQSVRNALEYVKTAHVLVTEAVRPFITDGLVKRVIEYPGDFVTPIQPAISTVIEWGGDGGTRVIPREQVGEVQMPQKYSTTGLRTAHRVTEEKNATDDMALLMSVSDIEPSFIPGLEENIKITTPLDLIIAEAIYYARYSADE